MSTIKSSTTSTTAFSVVADTTGTLVFQTGATPTTAMTLGSDQSVTFAGTPTYSGGTANGVAYLNSSKQLTTDSAFTYASGRLLVGLSSSIASNGIAQIGGNADTRLIVDGSSTQGIYFTKSGADNGTYRVDGSGNFNWFVKGSGSANMTLDASGNLLVGNTTGSGRLYVESSSTPHIVARNPAGASYSSIRLYNDANSNSRALEIDYSGSTYSGSLIASGPTGESAAITTTGSYPLVFGTANTARATIDTSGNFLVATQAPDPIASGVVGISLGSDRIIRVQAQNAPSGVFGRITSTGDVLRFYYSTSATLVGYISTNGTTVTFSGNALSDARWKQNVEPLQNALSAVMDVDFVSFDYKDSNRPSAGVTAQQLKTVSALSKFVIDGTSEDDYKAVDYNAVIGYLGKAIQEQQAIIQQLQADVAALKGVAQ